LVINRLAPCKFYFSSILDSIYLSFYYVYRKVSKLTNQERQEEIIRIVSLRGQVSIQDLSSRLGVSEVTLRKDLSFLEASGLLVRTRGGAMAATKKELIRPLEQRRTEQKEAKTRIAKKAREFIREGDTIFLDSGSTTQELALHIKDMSLRLVTNSIDVLIALQDAPEVLVFALGGNFRKDAGSFIGPQTLEALKSFNIDTCFIGTTGFSSDGYFSSQNIYESDTKKQAISRSKRRIILADSSKYGSEAFSVFASVKDIHIIISDSELANTCDVSRFPCEVILA